MPAAIKPSSKARVNITLDLETEGVPHQQELPLKLLVLGDFSAGGTSEKVADRKRLSVDKHSLDACLAQLSPTLRLENKTGQKITSLRFERMADFTPAGLVQQVPALKRLLAMRQLLRELKTSLSDKPALRQWLSEAFHDHAKRQALSQALPHLTAEEGDDA